MNCNDIDVHNGSTSLSDFTYSYQIASADGRLVGSRSAPSCR